MSREAHVRFCESLGLKCPGPLTVIAAKKRFAPPKTKHQKTKPKSKKG